MMCLLKKKIQTKQKKIKVDLFTEIREKRSKLEPL